MPKPATIDKFRDRFWDDIEKMEITPLEAAQLTRYRAIFSMKLENPSRPTSKLVEVICSQFNIGPSQAYRDIGQTEVLMTPMLESRKEYLRYLVEETLKEAIEMARDGNKPKDMALAAGLLGKYSRLDVEDKQRIPYEEIVPLSPDFVNDPTVLGLPAVENPRLVVQKALRKFRDAEPADFIEVQDGQ